MDELVPAEVSVVVHVDVICVFSGGVQICSQELLRIKQKKRKFKYKNIFVKYLNGKTIV